MVGRVALFFAALVLSLVLGEVALWLWGFEFPQFHERSDLLGLTLRPNAEGWYTEEGRSYVKVNSAGMRDVERSRVKPAGRLRIAVLGDSYTEAIQVERERAFPALLERRLGECGRPAEVLNFGVSGFGTAQQLLTLRSKVWDYAPDVVLLAFFPSNDVSNNSKALDPDKLRPFFVLQGDGLALDDSFRQSAKYRVLASPVYRYLRTHSRLLMLGLKARKGLAAVSAPVAATPDIGLDWLVFRPPAYPEWVEAWEVTERLLATMSRDVASHGATFAIASVTDPAALHPDPEARERYKAEAGITDFLYAERRLAAFAAKHGIAFLPLTEPMDRLAAGQYLHGFAPRLGHGHWNENGHRAAAQLIGEFLCAMPAVAAPLSGGSSMPTP